MSLVEDDDVVLGEEFASGGKMQAVVVMVGHDQVGLEGSLASLLGVALIAGGAACGPGALVGPDAYRRPDVGWGSGVELFLVAVDGRLGPGDDRS